MAGYQLPGVAGAVTNASPIDEGTLARTTSPSPGTVGAASTQSLSDHDLSFIQTTAGRTIGGARKPLGELQHLREVHLQRQAAAARESGPGSWAARFEQATVDCMSALIEEAQSPFGNATEQVRLLTEELRKSGSVATEDRLKTALEVLLGMERQRQLMGESDDNSETMPLLADALNASADRRNTVLKNLIEKATRARASVTEEQLRTAITDVLSVERQRQLLGVSTDSDAAASMALVNEATKLR